MVGFELLCFVTAWLGIALMVVIIVDGLRDSCQRGDISKSEKEV